MGFPFYSLLVESMAAWAGSTLMEDDNGRLLFARHIYCEIHAANPNLKGFSIM